MVVLAHGLWLNRHALVVWRRCFESRGITAVAFGYPSRERFTENVARLTAFVASQSAANIYCMGHSLGGLLILAMLTDSVRLPAQSLRRAVLAGTPVNGCLTSTRFARLKIGRWLIGGARSVLDANIRDREFSSPAGVEIGVIAGTRGIGFGRVFGNLPPVHDGTVSLTETRLAGARDSIALPLSHNGMLVSDQLVEQACNFFACGQYNHGHAAR